MTTAVEDKPAAAERQRLGRRRVRARRVPWILVVPALALTVAAHLVAVAYGAWYAFTDFNGFNDPEFIGLDNFRTVFDDPVTSGALGHTLLIAVVFVVMVNVIGLVLALGLHRALKTRNLLRSLFFLPAVMSPVATAYIWQYILQFDGPLNGALATFGLEEWQRTWLGDPTWALWTVVVVLVWQYSGLAMIIYLAGLQGIPDELDEAALVDGASFWMRFRRVTLPLLAPAFTITATLTLILGLRVFDQVLALTSGGPAGATETLATQVYKQTFANGNYGVGTALALILTVIIAVLSITQLVILRAREARMS